MYQPNSSVTLPQGVSLRCVAKILSDAWAAGPHQWTGTPLQLREGRRPVPPAPVPEDALDLFRLLQKRQIHYLLVGGMALLTYVRGRNTHDVDLLMSTAALEQTPGLEIEERTDFFARGRFRSMADFVNKHVASGDRRELQRILAECSERAIRLRKRTNS